MAFIKIRLSATITFLFFPILLDFLAKSSAANQSEYHTRVYEGFEAVDGQFPYVVLIYIGEPTQPSSICTGSLIQLDLVLTAAHCFKPVQYAYSVIVLAGKADALQFLEIATQEQQDLTLLYPQISVFAQVLRAKKLITHPEYKVYDVFDLALVRLEKKFTETKFVKTINYVVDTIHPDMHCIGMGYGLALYGYGLLNFYRIRAMLNATQCFADQPEEHSYCQLFDSQHTCQGDSGSPIVCNGLVYAVNSRAIYANNYAAQECKAPSLKLNVNIASAEKSKKFLQNYAKPASQTSASRCITVSQWLILLNGLNLLVL